MTQREQAEIVNHFAAVVRVLVGEILDTPLTDEAEIALKCDGIVSQASSLRVLARRLAEDRLDHKAEHPREACGVVEIGSWGRP